MPRLFGTDGVRGIANADLTPELAFRLGEAAGTLLRGEGRGRVVIGKDTRISGDMLESAVAAGVCAAGCDVLLAGIVPTPAVAFLVRDLGADAGVVISASHNPAAYNGIKFFDRDGFKLSDPLEDRIEAFAVSDQTEARPTGEGVGRVIRIEDAIERYVAHAVSTVAGRLDGLKVALDCAHGAASRTSEAAFRALGAEVVAINCDWNGTDINDDAGSTHLAPLTSLVRRRDHGDLRRPASRRGRSHGRRDRGHRHDEHGLRRRDARARHRGPQGTGGRQVRARPHAPAPGGARRRTVRTCHLPRSHDDR
jgi:phosphoglucosamine mutase